MALLAATTLGVAHIDRVRAAISSDQHLLGDDEGQGYRLIVQSYPRSNVSDQGLPPEGARPLGSVQRAVTAEELAEGVQVDILQLDEDANEADDPLVVAWVERGQPDLEFDARRARPTRDAFFGCSISLGARANSAAHVVLKRRAA
jgi:hypothetical protein